MALVHKSSITMISSSMGPSLLCGAAAVDTHGFADVFSPWNSISDSQYWPVRNCDVNFGLVAYERPNTDLTSPKRRDPRTLPVQVRM